MMKNTYQYIFLMLTKCIFTVVTASSLWLLCRTMEMMCRFEPAFYNTIPEQIAHLLMCVTVYVLFAWAGSYAVFRYDT